MTTQVLGQILVGLFLIFLGGVIAMIVRPIRYSQGYLARPWTYFQKLQDSQANRLRGGLQMLGLSFVASGLFLILEPLYQVLKPASQ